MNLLTACSSPFGHVISYLLDIANGGRLWATSLLSFTKWASHTTLEQFDLESPNDTWTLDIQTDFTYCSHRVTQGMASYLLPVAGYHEKRRCKCSLQWLLESNFLELLNSGIRRKHASSHSCGGRISYLLDSNVGWYRRSFSRYSRTAMRPGIWIVIRLANLPALKWTPVGEHSK